MHDGQGCSATSPSHPTTRKEFLKTLLLSCKMPTGRLWVVSLDLVGRTLAQRAGPYQEQVHLGQMEGPSWCLCEKNNVSFSLWTVSTCLVGVSPQAP